MTGQGATPENVKLRVLAITSELPWPLDTGGHLRTFHLLRAIAHDHDLQLISAATRESGDSLEALRGQGIVVRAAQLAERSLPWEAIRAVAARARGEPYVFYRRHDRAAVRTVFKRALAATTSDVVYLDHLDSFGFADMCASLPFVLDLHNSYSLLARRAAEDQRWAPIGWYLRGEAKRLASVERASSQRASVVTTVSRDEQAYYQSLGARDVRLVPNGVDCSYYASLPTGRAVSPSPVVLYVGNMTWAPNVAAVCTLIDEVMPEVRRALPAARVCIVGKGASPHLLAYRRFDWVEIAGSVPDVRPYLERASALAVPLEAGGGTRLKILEAFAAGLPVVSTPVGAEGIEACDGDELIITEKTAMAAAIVRVLTNHVLAAALAQAGRTLASRLYDWNVVGKEASAALRDAAKSRPRL